MARPTLAELKTRVLSIVQDTSLSAGSTIADVMNDGLSHISNEVALPDLYATSAVTATSAANYVALPSDFQRGLVRVYSTTQGSSVTIHGSLTTLKAAVDTEDQTGTITDVAVWGRNLSYEPTPQSAENLRLYYHREPTLFDSGSASAACLPGHLARPLLINWACWKLFERIEDGTEQQKVNTAYYMEQFSQAMTSLKYWAKPNDRGWSGLRG